MFNKMIRQEPSGRRFDWTSASMAIAASLFLAMGLQSLLANRGRVEPPGIGAVPPPLRLLDPKTGEPVVLVGLKGKIVWVSFVSPDVKDSQTDLADIVKVWRRLHAYQKFTMAVVAASPDDRLAVQKWKTKTNPKPGDLNPAIPTYLATSETAKAFGIESAPSLPVHFLIDAEGKVVAIGGAGMVDRLSKNALEWLDQIEPNGRSRFAAGRTLPPLEPLADHQSG